MKEIKGDLIKLFKDGKFDYIAHQCNMIVPSKYCRGIAKSIFEQYPDTANLHDDIIENRIGIDLDISEGIYVYNTKDNIVNLYTQYNPGPGTNHPDDIDYYLNRKEYLSKALDKLNKELKDKKLGIPLIASGLAKAMKYSMDDLSYFNEFIKSIVEDKLKDVDVTVVIYD